MASVQEPCKVELIAKRVDGKTKVVVSTDVTVLATGGGAADGAAASTTKINERLFLPAAAPTLHPNDFFIVQITTAATDGVDVSDCIWAIPVTEFDVNGRFLGVKYLRQSDFANPTPADFTATANIPQVFGGYKVTEAGLRIGGGAIYLDVQDDTA